MVCLTCGVSGQLWRGEISAVSKPSAIGGTWEAGSDESMQRLLVVITVTTPTLLPPGYPLK